MPLRIKCHSCQRTLVLDELYQGGFCRCAFCHTHQRVTHPGRPAPRPAARPDQPGLRIKSLGESHRAPPWTAGASIDIQEIERTPTRAAARWHWASTIVTAAVVMACVIAWQWSSVDGDWLRSGERLLADAGDSSNSVEARLAAARVDVDSLLDASDEGDFFGVAIDDGPIGIILDDSEAMKPFANRIAHLAYGARVHAESNDLGFSVIAANSSPVARNAEGDAIVAEERFFPLAHARMRRVSATFESRVASLADAVAMTNDMPPRKLFVVLARALPDDELNALTTAIQSRGIETHIISLGDAMIADFAAVAVAGNGWTIPVTDSSLASLIDRCTVEMPLPSK